MSNVPAITKVSGSCEDCTGTGQSLLPDIITPVTPGSGCDCGCSDIPITSNYSCGIGYSYLLQTGTWDLYEIDYPIESVILTVNGIEFLLDSGAADIDELLDQLNDLGLGFFFVNGTQIYCSSFHSWGSMAVYTLGPPPVTTTIEPAIEQGTDPGNLCDLIQSANAFVCNIYDIIDRITIIEPDNQIVVGTGDGVDSYQYFKYNDLTNTFTHSRSGDGYEMINVTPTTITLLALDLDFDNNGNGSEFIMLSDRLTSNAYYQTGYTSGYLLKPDEGTSMYHGDTGFQIRNGGATHFTTSAIGTGAEIRLYESGNPGSNYFGMRASASITNDWTIVWPTDTPVAGESLKVQGVSGSTITLEWA